MKRKYVAVVLSTAMATSTMAVGSVTAMAESTDRPTYEATFTASGTDADTYNTNVAALVNSFGDYYASTGELDKVTGYDETIPFTTVGYFVSNTQDAYATFESMYGETMGQNRWLDGYKQVYNVQGETKWLAQDTEYDQKLRLDIAAGELPDIFLVRNQVDLVEMADAGIIWDLTDLVDQYATEDLKTIWDSDNGIAMAQSTIDGSIYGLPSKISDTDNFSYLWIRSDWMEKLGLEYPETMEDLEAIMEAFVKADFDGNGQDDSVGIVLDKDLYYTTRGIFNGYSAYPEVWVEKDGALAWGGVTEENKAALSCLADWYQKGYISKEFITQDNTTAMESVMSGKCGIVYGGHWFGHTAGDIHELDPESDWDAVMLPTGNGEEVRSPLTSGLNGWVVVSKDFEHPELAFKLLAFSRAAMNSSVGQWWIFDQNVSWHTAPVRNCVSAFDNLFTYQNLMEAYENNDDTSILVGKAPVYWNNLHGDLTWEWEHMFGPLEHAAMTVLEDSYENDKLFYNAYYGIPSEFMNERWSTIKDEQLIAFTKMITGEVSVDDGFAAWLETFDSLGGTQITEEVNEWYNNK